MALEHGDEVVRVWHGEGSRKKRGLTRPVRFPLRRIRLVAGPVQVLPSERGPLVWLA
jgi:hypothetical protein